MRASAAILASRAAIRARMNACTVLRLLRGRVAARADRPARLIGDDRTRQGARAAQLEHRVELARDHRVRAPGLALRAAARPRTGSGSALSSAPRRTCARRADRPREQRAALRVADDDVSAAESLQHRRGHLARVRPVGIGADILRTELDGQVRIMQQALLRADTTNGGQTTHLARASDGNCAAMASIRRAFSAREPCIFQLPATTEVRMARYSRNCEPIVPGSAKGRGMIAVFGGRAQDGA